MIGGFSYGAEQVGWETAAFVEKDAYCQQVLAKNFPGIQIYDDVTTFDGNVYAGTVDAICGGFPCQDISNAGSMAGIEGERSGLWKQFDRIIREVRPRVVVVENVAALLGRGMSVVLGDLSACGYDAEWRVCSACELGAPQSRERVFLIAYPRGEFGGRRVFDRYCEQIIERHKDAEKRGKNWNGLALVPDAIGLVQAWSTKFGQSPLVRVVDGVPDLVDGMRGYGNSIIPEIAKGIFEAIDFCYQNK